MRCSICHSDNPETAGFCADCGARLASSDRATFSVTKTIVSPAAEREAVAGKYRFLQKLGEGGMGVVYKAYDISLEREVALKFLPAELMREPAARDRFVREARAAAALSHPHICTVFEINEQDKEPFIAMEYIIGRSLKEQIQDGPLEPAEALKIAVQVAEGLEEAHKKGIVHRDIKPGNIMVTDKGTAKVMDFGLAKVLGGSLITKEARTIGTVAYMSPEQARGEAVDHRTDIWSLGAMLYEMLTGELPFRGEYDQSMIHSILNREPKPLMRLCPNLPKALENIVLTTLAKNPAGRYQNMDELLSDLHAVAEGLKPLRAKTRLLRGSIFGIKKAYALTGLACLVVFVALGLVFLVPGGGPSYDSIAVLPLQNLTGDTQQDYFSEGMHEALITELSRISAIKVISRTSVMGYKGTTKRIPEIAKELGVKAVVEGSTMRSGDTVRINVQLIDGRRDRHLWADNFDREYREILSLQKEAALAIARQIQASLTPGEVEGLGRTRSVDPEAYDAYLKGMSVLNHVLLAGPKDLVEETQKSIDHFERALKIDPDFAPAYAGISFAYDYRLVVSAPAEVWPNVVAALNKALSLDDSLSEPHMMLADKAFSFDWDWEVAEREYRKALELNPNNALAHVWYGLCLICWGRKEEGLLHVDRARELDPLTYVTLDYSISNYLLAREYDKAMTLADHVISLFPDSRLPHFYRTGLFDLMGKHQEALEEAEKLIGKGEDENHPYLVIPYVRIGDTARARKAISGLSESPPGFAQFSGIAQIYAALGEADKAIDALEKAYEKKDPWMPMIKADPLMDPLRSEPRFKALLKKLRLEE